MAQVNPIKAYQLDSYWQFVFAYFWWLMHLWEWMNIVSLIAIILFLTYAITLSWIVADMFRFYKLYQKEHRIWNFYYIYEELNYASLLKKNIKNLEFWEWEYLYVELNSLFRLNLKEWEEKKMWWWEFSKNFIKFTSYY